jgi:quercetin dioxygenase-like cupin family protein
MAEKIEVVRGSVELTTPDKPFGSQSVFDAPNAHVGLTRLGPGAVTGWHHHGERTFYGYYIEGSATLESGPGGSVKTHLATGDLFRIPPRLVHRDVANPKTTSLIVTISVGEGPLSVAVEGPDG